MTTTPFAKTFSTLEAECWCRQLAYEDYVFFAKKQGIPHMCALSYELICEALDIQFEVDMCQQDLWVEMGVLE